MQKGRRHFKKAGVWMALLGVAILAASGTYDMVTYRASPKEPDSMHSVIQVSHGIQRFKTPEQINNFHYFNVAGLATFVVGVALLVFSERLRKPDA